MNRLGHYTERPDLIVSGGVEESCAVGVKMAVIAEGRGDDFGRIQQGHCRCFLGAGINEVDDYKSVFSLDNTIPRYVNAADEAVQVEGLIGTFVAWSK